MKETIEVLATESTQSIKRVEERAEILETLVRHSFDVIMQFDQKFRFMYVNCQVKQFFRIEQGYFIGKTCHGAGLSESFSSFVEDNLTRTFKTGKTQSTEFDYRTHAGMKVFQASVIPEYASGGDIVSTLFVARDITERKKLEVALRKMKEEFNEQKVAFERKNIALQEVLSHIELEKEQMQKQIRANVDTLLLPLVDRLRRKAQSVEKEYIDLLEHNLKEITSMFGIKITLPEVKLSPREVEICNLIKGGLTGKEISHLLNLSFHSIEAHRRNIRKKLGLTNTAVNLSTYIQNV
ncbi:MAG: PAS domain-containing protein [Candidatus Omnitrophica bacterium]|nr:PAS domain-containing protein [Candidatus Omnitrophota bacterium]